jgi:dipicolinate synthase subunit A
MHTFAVVGGDKRNIALAEMLFKQGCTVKVFGFINYEREIPMQCNNLQETVENADYVIGPIPCSHHGGVLNAPFHNAPVFVEELFRLLEPEQTFFAGYVKEDVLKQAGKHDVRVIDLLKREELLVANAIPTAFQPGDKKFWFHRCRCLCKRLRFHGFLRLLYEVKTLPIPRKIR